MLSDQINLRTLSSSLPTRRLWNSTQTYFYANLAVIGLAFWVRIVNLSGLPVFVDEGNHLAWAQAFAEHHPNYPFLMDGKFLLGVLLAQWQVIGGNPLWQARAALAIMSMLSSAAAIALGRQLGSRRAGLLAGVLYALLPFAVFHERQVLADPLMAEFGSVMLVFTPRLARQNGLRYVPLIAALFASALLTKLTAAVYVMPLILAVWLTPARSAERRRLVARVVMVLGLAGLMIFLALASLSQQLGNNDHSLANQQVGFIACPPLICHASLGEQLDNLRQAASTALPAIPLYFGLPLIALACLAWLVGPRRARRLIAWLFLSTVAMLVAFLLTARNAPPRYYSFVAVPLAALAGVALAVVAEGRLTFATPRLGLNSLGRLLVVGLAIQAGIYVGPLVLTPKQAQLTEMDQWQYLSGLPAGTGIDQAAQYLLSMRAAGSPPLVISRLKYTNATEAYMDLSNGLAAYFDPSRIKMLTWQADWAPEVAKALQTGQMVYVAEIVPRDTPVSIEPVMGLTTTLQASYLRLNGNELVRIRQVVGADAAARSRFFEALCARPDAMIANYQALAQSLAGQESNSVLLAYPPNQARNLSAQWTDPRKVTLLPIGDTWPLDSIGTAATLQQDVTGPDLVRMVFLNEGACDPGKFIETWLTTHLFRVDQHWFGAVRLVEYASAAEVKQVFSPTITFGDSIVLERVETTDPTVPAGGIVRIRLVWRAKSPVTQSLTVFVHLFNQSGIVAQHDGMPVGGLMPTANWSAGQTVIDQFAIRLPPDVHPGDYQLRVGLYDANTQVRVPALSDAGASAEFYVGGHVTVAGSQ